VLTLDKDFRQIAVQRRSPLEQSGVILFRVHPATPENIARLVRALSRQTRRGLDTSASSRWTEFRWWRRAESEAPSFSRAEASAEIPTADRIAYVSVLLAGPVDLPESANQRMSALHHTVFVANPLA